MSGCHPSEIARKRDETKRSSSKRWRNKWFSPDKWGIYPSGRRVPPGIVLSETVYPSAEIAEQRALERIASGAVVDAIYLGPVEVDE